MSRSRNGISWQSTAALIIHYEVKPQQKLCVFKGHSSLLTAVVTALSTYTKQLGRNWLDIGYWIFSGYLFFLSQYLVKQTIKTRVMSVFVILIKGRTILQPQVPILATSR